MSNQATFKGVVKLPSEADFQTLQSTGTITIGGVTVTYSPQDTLYVVPDTTTPTTTATINGNADTYTISNGGTYIFLGDVGTLTITATNDVTVSVLGTLGSVTLPETTQTILIHTVGYSGTFDTRPNSLKNGSVLGSYNIGRIDLA